MNILKANKAFERLVITSHLPNFNRVDVRNIYKNLQMNFIPHHHSYFLKTTDYSNKSIYDRLPRCVKYELSE